MSAIRVARGHTGRAQGREVRRQLPRPRRPAARRGRQRARRPRPARLGRRHRRGRGRHRRRALQRRCPTLDERHRLRHRRAGRRQHGPGPARRRVPQGPARRVRPRRRPARLRRGDHRVPRRPTAARRSAAASRPTSSTFGKVIGGGLNIGAYGGRRDVMQQVAPLGPVYQAGTLSGNPLATAAGLAALDLLDAAAYATLTATAERLAAGLRDGVRRRPGIDGGRAAGRQPRRPLLRRRRAGRLRRPRSAPTRRATPRSSTPCSTAAWPSPRAPTRCMFPGLAHTGRRRRRDRRRRRRRGRRRSPMTARHGDRCAASRYTARTVSRLRRRRPRRPRSELRRARRGRAACSPATTRSGATTPPSWPTGSGGSRSIAEVRADLPGARQALRRARRGHRARARDGHGRLEPLPRGAGPHAAARARPPAAPRARHHRPGRHRAVRPRVRPRHARCTSRRRSPAPPSRPAATSSGRGRGPGAAAASP